LDNLLRRAFQERLDYDESGPIPFASWLLNQAARRGLDDGPSVLITTADVSLKDLREQFRALLAKLAAEKKLSETASAQEAVLGYFNRNFILRRLEVHDMSSAVLFQVIARSIEAAQRNLFHVAPYAHRTAESFPVGSSWPIRVVLDDLSIIRDMYPDVREDALFLPFLTSYLEREAVTSLIVASQSGRPDLRPLSDFDLEFRNLLQKQIRTWQALFYGETRVAIAELTSGNTGTQSKIRELRFTSDYPIPVVDPHFELYEGLEIGELHRVRLEIRLFGETTNFQNYVTQENILFNDLFEAAGQASDDRPAVITAQSPLSLEKLKDFAQLHRDTKLDRTLLMQMDEFWALRRRDALRSMWDYLDGRPVSIGAKRSKESDVYGLFQNTLASPISRGLQDARKRRDEFTWIGYRNETPDCPEDRDQIDRIPYMWDFGFLLCREEAWQGAGAHELHLFNQNQRRLGNPAESTVENVWEALPKAKRIRESNAKRPPSEPEALPPKVESRLGISSWRAFIEATRIVAAVYSQRTSAKAIPFDLAFMAPDSFSCLVLEIWGSEIFRKAYKKKRAHTILRANSFCKRSWWPSTWQGIIHMLAEPDASGSLAGIFERSKRREGGGVLPELSAHCLELFKTFLLLREVLDISSLVDSRDPYRLRQRPPDESAVSARHWYNTACDVGKRYSQDGSLMPVGLPGHLAVRGDWYLAVAGGSRSDRLADSALDVLSSRRANITRLQLGLGLPVRSIIGGEQEGRLQTPLFTIDSEGRKECVNYKQILSLGPRPSGLNSEEIGFYWLWRSALGNYDSHSGIWQKWLVKVLHWWKGIIPAQGTSWKGALQLYDDLEYYQSLPETSAVRRQLFEDHFKGLVSLWLFPELCE
jgi:hypothetical protein